MEDYGNFAVGIHHELYEKNPKYYEGLFLRMVERDLKPGERIGPVESFRVSPYSPTIQLTIALLTPRIVDVEPLKRNSEVA